MKRIPIKQLIQIRDESYQMQDVRACMTCRFGWFRFTSDGGKGTCQRIELRGELVRKDVSRLGVCDLWEEKPVEAS